MRHVCLHRLRLDSKDDVYVRAHKSTGVACHLSVRLVLAPDMTSRLAASLGNLRDGQVPRSKIYAIFFAVFHPKAGPSIEYQVPADFVGSSITGVGAGLQPAFCIEMDSISEYIIPKSQLCNRVISVCNSGYRIIGHPVRVEGAHYERNAFIFNCCIVFDDSDDISVYIPMVRRLARVLKSMEELKGSLSLESERGIVRDVLEQVLEDLNVHGECCIPVVDDEVTLSIKLFENYPQPLRICKWHVPVPLESLKVLVDSNWDLTLQRIIPFIDGISSVQHISDMADVDPDLTTQCISHLCYYQAVVITDIFQFKAIYAATPELDTTQFDIDVQKECCSYVVSPLAVTIPSWDTLFELYASLRHGLQVKDWIKLHYNEVRNIDPRRFILFGILHGFIYRVYSYPFISPEYRTTDLTLMADGTRHFDAICTEQGRPLSEVTTELQAVGTTYTIHI